MPNTREIVRALVSAFNVHNYARDTVKTNFTLRSEGKKGYIVVSFDKGMKDYQCSEYLYNIKRKIVGEFYGIEEGDTDEVVLNTANLIFNIESFPFDTSRGKWSQDEQGRIEFLAPTDKDVIFNLKSHLASSLVKDVLEDMPTCSIVTNSFNKGKYLCHSKFPNKELCKEFEREFLSRMENIYGYRNVFKNPLKVEGNSVYIKDVFDDARFIDSVTRRAAWLIGRDLQADSKSRSDVRAFKDLIMEILDPSTRVVTSAFLCASPLNREEASILIPVILSNRGTRFLTKEEARDINHKFNNPVLDDISDKTQATFKVNGSSGIYGIDFSNKEISHCVITKIIESSVINKDHELAIDPERALSPVQSPCNSPTHAGPSGLRTPPNQRKKDTDSGYDSNSPPKPKDSVAPSPSGGPSSYFTESLSPTQEFPTRDQNVVLKDSPRRESEKFVLLPLPLGTRGVPGTSKGFSPSLQLNSIAVSYDISGPSSSVQSVSAVQNVQAGTNAWSSPAPSAEPLLQPSRPLSWQGANPVGANPWAQQTNPCLSQGTPENKWISSMQLTKPGLSGLSWKGADKNVRDTWYVSSPLTTRNDPTSSNSEFSARSPGVEDVNGVEPEKQQVSDECSEAKSQESESPKKHGGRTILNKILSPFKRNNKNRSSTSSSVSAPGGFVTEKPPVSKSSFSFPSRIKAKSNPPSEVTSPTHEGAPGGLKPLTSDERKELRPFLSPELQKKLDSNSFSPVEEQHLYLTHTLSGKREIKNSFENPEENLRRSVKAQLPGDRSSQAFADSGLGKSLERGQSPSLIGKFSDELLINSRVDSPNIKKHLQKEKGVFV